ncbi:hypothetical protein ACO9S2_06895 [Nitrospira sp. NS4]|uniref:hypothetical protein n=1 Tax=Nitrospira sp. NS4 TaxID=3414498 RepID=UPI003C2F4DAC
MPFLLSAGKKFTLFGFESETEFERAVVENSKYLFGPEAIYIDIKKRVGLKDSYHKGIPDAFLIDFSNPKSPTLYFVENELLAHDIYSHIVEQVGRFMGAGASSGPRTRDMLLKHIKGDSRLRKAIEAKLQKTPFANLEELMISLTEKGEIRVVVAVDDEDAELNQALTIFRTPPDRVVLRRFLLGTSVIYECEPMGGEVEQIEGSKVSNEDFDTVVCAAFDDGFQRAYVKSNAWWAIRLSQKAREKIRYLAIYQKSPIKEIQHVAEIKRIEPYKDSGKFIVYLGKKMKIRPIPLDKARKGTAPQSPRFTTFEKLKRAKTISQLWNMEI